MEDALLKNLNSLESAAIMEIVGVVLRPCRRLHLIPTFAMAGSRRDGIAEDDCRKDVTADDNLHRAIVWTRWDLRAFMVHAIAILSECCWKPRNRRAQQLPINQVRP